MSTVVAKVSNITTRLQVGTAAVALTAAAVMTPAVIAQAEPGGLAPVPQAVGASAWDDTPWFIGNDPGAGATGFAAQSLVLPPAVQSIFQNRLFWFGTPNPNPPPGGQVFTFTPLTLIPGFLRPLYSWFTQNLNFSACILGATINIGPYGAVEGRLTQGC